MHRQALGGAEDADLIAVCPPLIVTREQIDTIVRLLGEAISEVASAVAPALSGVGAGSRHRG